MRLSAFLAFVFSALIWSANAGSIWIPGVEGVSNVAVDSIAERKFQQVVRQQYDFSCGSAAIATLLTYHYEQETGEQDAFRFMYETGDQEKITREGFSLLDMKKYLDFWGFQADGYEATLDTLTEAGVPAITLINYRGYRHFVVVKGIENGEVLVGDPALGLRFMGRAEFESMWDNGILFIIRNKPDVGQHYFNADEDWSLIARAPLGESLSRESLADYSIYLPRQITPLFADF